MLIYHVLGFLIACVVLVKSAGYAAKHTTIVARQFHVSSFAVSMLLFGVLSTLPETSVSLMSAANKVSNIGFGTLAGSNIADVTIILGIVALVARKLTIKAKLVIHEAWFMLLVLFPYVLAYDGIIDRNDGILLLIAGIFFFRHIIKERRIVQNVLKNNDHTAETSYSVAITVLNILLLIGAAYFVVHFSQALSLDLGISPIVLASIFIALGTCLPELFFSIQATRMKQDELALGDIVGNVVVDATIALGLTAMIAPIVVPQILVILYGAFTFGGVATVLALLKIRNGIRVADGLILILYYIIFVFTELVVKNVV